MQTILSAESLMMNGFLLILLALVTGTVLGIAACRLFSPRGVDGPQAVEFMNDLFQWTTGLSQEMAEYRTAVKRMTENYASQSDVESQDTSGEPSGIVAKIMAANETLQARLNDAEQALQQQTSEISSYVNEARTDALTHLDNRRAFDEQLSRRFAEWRRHETPLSIVLVDIDHFKKFNDTHGHLAGDEVLVGVARVMRQAMRESDIVARFGGEEFAMILPTSDWENASRAAQRIRQAVENAVLQYENKPLGVTVSCGVAQAVEAESVKQLLQRADAALYASKNAGRNCAHLHDGQTCVPLEEAMRQAAALKLSSQAPNAPTSEARLSEARLSEARLWEAPTSEAPTSATTDKLRHSLSEAALRSGETPDAEVPEAEDHLDDAELEPGPGRVKRSFDDVCRRLQERFRNVARREPPSFPHSR